MSTGLLIAFEPPNGKAVTLARVANRRLLLAAAVAAIAEADHKAAAMETEHEVLAALQRDEAARLRRALEFVLPELKNSSPVTRTM